MPVIAVVNRKGGSGKSTLATHLAAWCAHAGLPTMLGDIDRQQSTQTWLRLREASAPIQRAPLVGWAVDPRRILRPPSGIHHVVLDTPGGLRGFDLARVAAFADAILMPVCNSVFDRESAAECHAELQALPRVAAGRCKVAAVGMRIDGRTRASEVLADWAATIELPFLGVLRETQAYVRCVEQGLTLFDLPPAQVQIDLAQWQPVLDWLGLVLRPEERTQPQPLASPAMRPTFPCHRPEVREGETFAGIGGGAPTRGMARELPDTEALPMPAAALRAGGVLGWLQMPRFLQRSA